MRRGSRPAGALRSLRERNRTQVIEVLRHRGSASRADIARATGLSRATISSLVADLQAEGLVSEQGDAHAQPGSQGGRPGVLLSLDARAGTAVGADFGHRHVHVALADLSSRVLGEQRRELDVDHAGAAALDAAAEMIEELLAETDVDRDRVIGVGMGLPAPFERATGVVGSSLIVPGWAGMRPAAELEGRLGLQVEIDNDANLGALGELAHGVGRDAADMIYLKVASGIGAGLILGGRLYRGATGIAGEIGHVIVAPGGTVCRCGNRGCLETVAAGPALVELLRRSYGDAFTAADMLAASAAGDVGCRRVLSDGGRAIGRALADLVNVLNPSLIVIGGELSAAGEPLLEGIHESIRLHALPAAAEAASITAGTLGERAALLGALALVISHTPHPSVTASTTKQEGLL